MARNLSSSARVATSLNPPLKARNSRENDNDDDNDYDYDYDNDNDNGDNDDDRK